MKEKPAQPLFPNLGLFYHPFMNLILLHEDQAVGQGLYRLSGPAFTHVRDVHKASVGQTLKVGLIDGPMGVGEITQFGDDALTLKVQWTHEAPAALPCTLILALPRPKMMRRILETISTMGVKDLYLINTYKVDKSYWSTPFLNEDALQERLLMGLEQSKDTQLPKVHLRKRFKPFVEDELPGLCHGKRALVAHPYEASALSSEDMALTPTVLAIGPEGGFIPYEVDKLQEAGMQSVHIGQRILRVETAIPALLSRLFSLI
jgi:16S rRNA (uracil1498-N3)-methyltransferase